MQQIRMNIKITIYFVYWQSFSVTLRKKLAEVEEERDILKKAFGVWKYGVRLVFLPNFLYYIVFPTPSEHNELGI